MRDFVAYVRHHLPRRNASLARYDEVVDELASELEARYTGLIQRGASDEDAWREVQAQVPSWPALAEDLAAVGSGAGASTRLPWLRRLLAVELWKRELAFGLRVLRKDRGFTATAIVTLAVCLGGQHRQTLVARATDPPNETQKKRKFRAARATSVRSRLRDNGPEQRCGGTTSPFSPFAVVAPRRKESDSHANESVLG
jgi:hypothetical protein